MAAPEAAFRWRARIWHLTYSRHLPRELLLAKLASVTSIQAIGTSIVHEQSDEDAPYDHPVFWDGSLASGARDGVCTVTARARNDRSRGPSWAVIYRASQSSPGPSAVLGRPQQ